ncbi:hypothetical protein [Actinophytocola sp.]|uniref:hypothetical protein n=1 Tax=Actinophytocola sp. TaxID=1872138 RepID=UPI003899CBCE
MTIIILDRHPGGPPPYADWLADAGEDLVLITNHPATDVDGYAEVRYIPDHGSSAELAVLELAATTTVSALVATATPDLVRAGALRDHLGIEGQGRAAATVLADPVAMRQRLRAAGVPTIPAGAVQRVSDLYWYRHRWGGGPVRVRRRKDPGWPTAAILRDERDLRAFTANGLTPNLITVPSLLVEPDLAGSRHVVHGSTQDGRKLVRDALSALPCGPELPYRVEILRAETGAWLVDTVDSAVATDHRAVVREQAGLPSREVTRWAS